MANYVPRLKKVYKDEIAPALMKEFSYTTPMQIPAVKKVVVRVANGVDFLHLLVHEVAEGIDVILVGSTNEDDVLGMAVVFLHLGHPAVLQHF